MRSILRIRCPKCRGLLWEEFISDSHVDLSCLYCAARFFVKKTKYLATLKRIDKKLHGAC